MTLLMGNCSCTQTEAEPQARMLLTQEAGRCSAWKETSHQSATWAGGWVSQCRSACPVPVRVVCLLMVSGPNRQRGCHESSGCFLLTLHCLLLQKGPALPLSPGPQNSTSGSEGLGDETGGPRCRWFCPQCEHLYGEKSESLVPHGSSLFILGTAGRITNGLSDASKEFLRFTICTLPHILSVID